MKQNSRTIVLLISVALRVFALSVLFGGPVYGVSEMRIEGGNTFSNGAGIVLLTALQRN